MKYHFDISQQEIFDFEQLLKNNGLTIQTGSDLERVLFAVLEANAKAKKEIEHDNSIDIREFISDVAGIIDFVKMILKHKNHPDFGQIKEHLKLLNTASTATLTSKSRVTDDGNNKLLELYIALLCMSFATNICLDNPSNSKGDNPDIMFDFQGERWAIACKALHSNNEKTLYDTIKKGTEQIKVSSADKGIVVVNFKNIIDRNKIWALTNQEQVEKDNEEPLFACFSDIQAPVQILNSYSCDFRQKLIDTIGLESLIKLSENKCPAGFLVFLQAVTGFQHNGKCVPTILKTFNLVSFETTVPNEYIELANKLNEAMHDRI